MKGVCHGQDHGRAGEGVTATITRQLVAAKSSPQDGHGSQVGGQISGGEDAQRETCGTQLADSARSLGGGVAAGASGTRTSSRLAGPDTADLVAGTLSRAVRQRTAADPATARASVACPGGTGQGGVLHAGACAGPAGLFGLHVHEQPPGDHPGATLRAHGVSLRADLLELGACDDLFLGEFCQSERRFTERVVGPGRRAPATSNRPHDAGGASGRKPGSVHAELPGAAGTLWPCGGGNQPGEWARERRLRTGASAFQGSGRAGLAVAWQPGLYQP